jgi:methionyl-tRNA formyltransferase
MIGISMGRQVYMVATIRPWNVEVFHERIAAFPGEWHLITAPEQLSVHAVNAISPRYIFFPHWSVQVPASILDAVECVGFHATDLPFGRGGSPIQNLILRGHCDTQVCALRMSTKIDAGPVYLRRPLSLAGRAEEIYERLANVAADMIQEIIATNPQPQPQHGEPTIFARRTPLESELPRSTSSLDAVHNLIRMLDAPEYPRAFIKHGSLRIEFLDSALGADHIDARVRIEVDTMQAGQP